MTDDGAQEHGNGLARAKLWGIAPRARRGPKPKLSLGTIVDAALGLARGEGLAAVTMGGVAEAVGCAKMALYRHVSDRDDLLAAMLDTTLGEPPVLDGSWRERFATLWEGLLDLYAHDPWVLGIPADCDTLTPRNAEWLEAGLRLFETSALPYRERLGTVYLITENARFVARQQLSEGSPVDDLDRLLSSATQETALLPPERYPHLAEIAASDQLKRPIALPAARIREMMMRAVAPYFPVEAS